MWKLLAEYDVELLELFNALASLFLGGWLMNQALVRVAPAMAWLSSVAPIAVWSLVLAGAGIAQITALLFRLRRIRRRVAQAMALLWLFVAVGTAVAGGTLAALALVIALGQGLVYIRLSWAAGHT